MNTHIYIYPQTHIHTQTHTPSPPTHTRTLPPSHKAGLAHHRHVLRLAVAAHGHGKAAVGPPVAPAV